MDFNHSLELDTDMSFETFGEPKHLAYQATKTIVAAVAMLLWSVALIVVLSMLSVKANAFTVDQSELNSGDFELRTASGYTPALHLDTAYNVSIDGMIANVTVEQRFQNSGDEWLNGRYVFPLSETSAVSHMEMVIGERRILSKIKEKKEAKKIFKQAQAAGKKAALVEQHRPNVFSQSVANIGPQETISITLRYSQPVDFKDGVFSLRVPMTMTPRYTPKPAASNNGEINTETTQTGPWLTANTQSTTGNFATIDVKLNSGLPLASIDSLYHETRINKQAGLHHIQTQQSRIAMDRDYVLQWRASTAASPKAAVFTESKNGDRYALLMVVPPETLASQTLARETLFIIDSSGSMGGASMRQAKASLLMALERLTPEDYFNIYDFDSNYRPLYGQSEPATAINIDNAKRFVRNLTPEGGTEMAAPLKAALTAPSPEQDRVRQVVFITDGSVSNESELFGIIDQHLGQAKLFTVGIGSAPNSYFMRKAAEFGRGTFTFIASARDVQFEMSNLFSKLEKPMMQNINIEWDGNQQPDVWPAQIPDLYAGEPLLLVAKLNGNSSLRISGERADSTWRQQLNIPSESTSTTPQSIAQTWARKKIEQLLDTKHTGTNEITVRSQVLPLALEHHLVSPYTSLVAVEERISNPNPTNTKQANIAQNKPHGQQVKQLQYPQTATGLMGYLMISFASALLLIMRRITGKKGGK